LVDIARGMLAEEIERPARDRWLRRLLRFWLPYPWRFGPVWRLLQVARPVLPAKLRRKIFPSSPAQPWPERRHGRRMLALDGCVQPILAPSIDAAAARLLDRLGISLMRAPGSGCCGALSYHLDAQDEGLAFVRRNIDAWWPWIERGVEAIVVTASGCGVWVKEYGELLRGDPEYAEKAAWVSALARDPAEVLSAEDWRSLKPGGKRRIAFHSPCTLQHGQKLSGVVEPLLRGVGFELTPVRDPYLCCGAAGAYSILQPELANRLLDDRLTALQAGQPDGIATANIGCLVHLASQAEVPIRHWLEWLDG
jgi:glycolate oxidase iron-sulfur subunit